MNKQPENASKFALSGLLLVGSRKLSIHITTTVIARRSSAAQCFSPSVMSLLNSGTHPIMVYDTAQSTLNLYWCMGIDILDFRIVEILPMHLLCFLDKTVVPFPDIQELVSTYLLLQKNYFMRNFLVIPSLVLIIFIPDEGFLRIPFKSQMNSSILE